MKLYLYTLDSKNHLVHEEYEIKENKKTYQIIENTTGLYRSRINKDEIGCVTDSYYANRVFLIERNDMLAAKIFSKYFQKEINKLEHHIKEYERIIYNINSLVT